MIHGINPSERTSDINLTPCWSKTLSMHEKALKGRKVTKTVCAKRRCKTTHSLITCLQLLGVSNTGTLRGDVFDWDLTQQTHWYPCWERQIVWKAWLHGNTVIPPSLTSAWVGNCRWQQKHTLFSTPVHTPQWCPFGAGLLDSSLTSLVGDGELPFSTLSGICSLKQVHALLPIHFPLPICEGWRWRVRNT